jgi:oligoribonuclease
MNDRLVWIDCEMTGLDLAADALIEVAVLVTDYDLNVLGDGIDLVIAPPPGALEQMGDFVRDMHTGSGLLAELEHGIPLADAEQQVLEFISGYVKEPRKAALAGNSVGTDRTFLVRDMPRVEAHLHYRNVDVSSIKELVRRWYPRVYYAPPRRPAITGRWRTSPRASRSSGTTARPSSSRSPGPTPTRPERSPP